MPIRQTIGTRLFTDQFGNSYTNYRANAGDKGIFSFDFTESIYTISSSSAPITSSATLRAEKKLRFPNYLSLLGFEIGQNVVLLKTASNGSTTTKVTTITDIDYSDLTIQFDSLLTPANANLDLYNDTATMQVYSTDMREQLDLSLGFGKSSEATFSDRLVSNISQLSYRKSLIDGTNVTLSYPTGTMIVTDVENLVQNSVKSGSFEVSATIERLANVNSYTRKWRLSFELVQIGGLAQIGFTSADSQFIRLYYDLEFKSLNNTENSTITQYLDGGLTGWYNSPFNSLPYNSTVINPVTNPLFYDDAVTNTITFESTSPVIALGAQYFPQTDEYYKIKPFSQSELCMLIDMDAPLAIGIYTSEVAPDGSFYEIEITALTYIANIHTVTFIFRNGNTAFSNFIDSRGDFDRIMYIYFKVGNINHLMYQFDLLKAVNPTINLTTLETTPALFKLDKNTDNYTASSGLICSIEDNVYLEQQFLLPKDATYLNSKFEIIVAEVGNLDNNFVLEGTFFDLSNFTPLVDGALPFSVQLNNPQGLNVQGLQFQNALFSRKGASPDTLTHFGITTRYPFLINWKYWLEQNNAFVVFDEERNKNWINYNDGTYQIYVKTTIETSSSFLANHYEIDTIYDYDQSHTDPNEEWNGTTAIEYIVDSTNEVVNALINGELMKVKVTVGNIYAGTSLSIWGQMTIEPTESTPRYSISTNHLADTNVNNPFLPLVGSTRLKHIVGSPTFHTFEALIDTEKLTGTNHKITFKFFNDVTPIEQNRKDFNVILTDKSNLTSSDSEEFDIYGNKIDLCCLLQKVFAETTFTATERNDVTAMWYLLTGGDSVAFELWKNDVLIETFTQSTFPNTSNARKAQVIWSEILTTFGAGCYQLRLNYNPAFGDDVYLNWGTYNLQEWSGTNAINLVNIRSKFDSNQTNEGIDFTGSTLCDSINVGGFFGNRDPKTEVDNNIYNTRLQSKITRENLNEYTLETEPIEKDYSRKLLDLHLLSENDCWISDYNPFNHEDYKYKRVIVSAVESPEYYQYSKKSKIIAKFEDKIKNSRSFY